jgi:hypothetical protein
MSKSTSYGRARVGLLALACTVCIASCAGTTTKFEQVWRGPGAANLGSVQRVVTLYDSPDGAMRRNVEDEMARKLAQRGLRAVPSYSVLDASQLTENADRQHRNATLAAKGFDGVVEIRLVGTENYPGDTHGMGWSGYDGYGYWGLSWPYAYDNYVFDSPVVRVETNLYSLHDNQLVWSARSKTVDADDTNEVIDEVTTLVASTLERRGMANATARR